MQFCNIFFYFLRYWKKNEINLFFFDFRKKGFKDFNNKQKSLWSNVFWYVKVCIFWHCIQYTIHWDKTETLKKIFFGQNKQYKKMLSFFFSRLQLITVLLLVCDSYKSWSTRFVSLRLSVGFSIFDSFLFLLKFLFLFNKMHGLFHFKTSKFLSKLK